MRTLLPFNSKQWIYAALLFSFFILLNSSFFWKQMYPIHYEEEVVKAARHFQVDPYLILAVMKIESDFNPDRSSDKGATGLMQLMPETAEWIKKRSGIRLPHDGDVQHPEANVLMGTWYLAFLLEKYEGDHVKVLVAYNAGQGNVDRWIKEGIWDGHARSVDQIPFGETRHYVKRALFYYERYKTIYSEEFNGFANSSALASWRTPFSNRVVSF
jgi:soluble lytic murein transglycosylase